jgi:hypothetical protein
MSALGQKQTLDWRPLMSALPPKADITGRQWDVRFVPKAAHALQQSRPVISTHCEKDVLCHSRLHGILRDDRNRATIE